MCAMGDTRVVVLVDMDCFYCQVEAKLNPKYRGKPLAVVQYNAWRGGGIIAVNYEARDKGVKRGMRGDQALKLCPNIVLARVEEVRGKANLTKYRDAGKEVVKVFHDFSDCIERASIDEAYIDITKAVEKRMQEITELETGIFPSQLPSTFIIGFTDDKSNEEEMRAAGLETWLESLSEPNRLRLAVGAWIVEELRAAVFDRTSFRCSAGISYNKILSKLVCGIHKPNRQTVLPPDQVEQFFSSLPIRKVRSLGGKFGTEVVERLGCQTMGDLAQISLRDLQKHYDEKNGTWLYNIARGIDNDPVTVRLIPKSIGCSKNFPGRTALATKKKVEHWMGELVSELVARLTEDQEENKRRAKLLTVMVTQDTEDNSSGSTSRSGPLPDYNADQIVATALSLIAKTNTASSSDDAWFPPLKHISFSAGKFVEDSSLRNSSIQNFFRQVDKEDISSNQDASVVKSFHEGCSTSMSSSAHFSLKEQLEDNSYDSDSRYDDNSRVLKVKKSCITNHFKPEGEVHNASLSRGTGITEHQDINASKSIGQSKTCRNPLRQNRESTKIHPEQATIAICPNDFEGAVYHSFFAKYIVQMKKSNNSIDHKEKTDPSSNHPHASPKVIDNDIENILITENDNSRTEGCEKCVECGEMVALQDFPEHVDYHSALKLQKELDDNPTPPESALARNQGDIFDKVNSSDDQANDSNSTILERCSYCSQLIPLDEFPEHVDYHSALELQRELNLNKNEVPISSASSSNSNTIPHFGKRKRGRPLKQGPSPTKKVRTTDIATFFAPK